MPETPMQAGPELDAEIARRVFGVDVLGITARPAASRPQDAPAGEG